ncbi:MAG: hypothetical protein ABFS45_26285 [Pseudomonadota bacterium]
MDYKSLLFLFFVPMVLVACASNQAKQPEIEEIFVTDIKSNGIKLFNYTVTVSRPSGSRGGTGRGKRGGESGKQERGSAGRPDRESMMKGIKEKLDARLSETGYCREGYIVLGRSIGRGRSFIRGECKEGATEDDRTKFSNSDNT